MHTKFKVLVRAWALSIGLAFVGVAGMSTAALAQTAAPVAAPVATEVKTDATVLIMLGIMSMGSWYILAVKMLEQAKAAKFAREATEKFWSAGTVAQGAAALHKDSPYQFIAAAGVEATKKHSGLMGHIPLTDWISMSIQRSVDRVNREMQGGLSFLATVGHGRCPQFRWRFARCFARFLDCCQELIALRNLRRRMALCP